MQHAADYAWLCRLPKVELHVHLEGAIPHEALWELIQKYGGDPTVPDKQALKRVFAYRDFPHFIETWIWKNRFLREYDDFVFIAEATAREFSRQNIRYVEAFYSPRDFAQHGLKTQPLTESIRAGLARVPDVCVQLVADLIRDFGPARAAETLAEVNEVREAGVIGVGIGGSEQDFPPEPFADVFEQARQLGFRTSAHAGEAAGPESVWGAIRALKVDRVGHGTRAIEDQRLVDYLAETQIPIELNPISNVCTRVVECIAAHPVRHYLDRGLLVCINTDDPQMFHNTLADEFRQLQQHCQITRDDVRSLILNAIRASWLSSAEKSELAARFESDPLWSDDGVGNPGEDGSLKFVRSAHALSVNRSCAETIRLSARDGYDRWAAIYDDEDNPLVLLEHDQVERLMKDVRGLDILDAGCGTGRHSLLLAGGGGRVTAIDFSAAMLVKAQAKADGDEIEFLQHDLETALPFPAASFDRVISGLVVDHIHDLASYLSELRRVCRPNGRVVITVMHPALMLRGAQARFTDPETGALTLPASQSHQVSDYVMAGLKAGFTIRQMSEHFVDESLTSKSARARRYLGWPMLLLFELTP